MASHDVEYWSTIRQSLSGGAHTAVGANPRPNDPVSEDCLADKSCQVRRCKWTRVETSAESA
jgi:hypothetical protein